MPKKHPFWWRWGSLALHSTVICTLWCIALHDNSCGKTMTDRLDDGLQPRSGFCVPSPLAQCTPPCTPTCYYQPAPPPAYYALRQHLCIRATHYTLFMICALNHTPSFDFVCSKLPQILQIAKGDLTYITYSGILGSVQCDYFTALNCWLARIKICRLQRLPMTDLQ